MTVAELIAILEIQEQDATVIILADGAYDISDIDYEGDEFVYISTE
jgi:hypothetical protein